MADETLPQGHDFSHLSDVDVRADTTSIYVMTALDPAPKLIVAPALESNRPYFNAVLRRQRKNAAALRAGRITTAMIEANRDEDRDLYPLHVIRGWVSGVTERVKEADGKVHLREIPFNPEVCKLWIRALPDWVFDDLRTFCGNPINFADPIEVEDQVGNSRSG